MTEQELAAIKARADAATEGPWAVYHDEVAPYYFGIEHKLDEAPMNRPAVVHADDSMEECDATFIAHARQDIPALVAEVRRLQGECCAGCEYGGGRETCGLKG